MFFFGHFWEGESIPLVNLKFGGDQPAGELARYKLSSLIEINSLKSILPSFSPFPEDAGSSPPGFHFLYMFSFRDPMLNRLICFFNSGKY